MKEKRKSKKRIILLIIFIVVTTIIGVTYSRYISGGKANINIDVAKWQVKLNGDDMTTTPITKDVTLNYVANEYVKEDRIAPGRKATFDIMLDPTGSEVAIDYIISVNSEEITGITDANSKISITGAKYKIGNDGLEQEASINGSGELVIRENLSDVESGKTVTITATIEWDNDNDGLSSSDTANGATAGIVKIPVTVIAEQHM